MNFTTKLEIKALKNRQFEGHGSVFGNVDYGGDIVLKGAFERSLAEHKSEGILPQMFWMHDASQVPGKWLDMSEDDTGLYVKGELADTQLGKDTHTLLKMDAVRGMSIGYQTKDYDFDKDGNRLLKEVALWEVSVVSLAMNPEAQVHYVKSRLSEMGEYVPTDKEIAILKRKAEQFLRGEGFAKRLATACASNLFKDFGATPGFDQPLSEMLDDSNAIFEAATEELESAKYADDLPDEKEVDRLLACLKNQKLVQEMSLYPNLRK